jgi:hypothetical protein
MSDAKFNAWNRLQLLAQNEPPIQLILIINVLEHIDADETELVACHRLLKPAQARFGCSLRHARRFTRRLTNTSAISGAASVRNCDRIRPGPA